MQGLKITPPPRRPDFFVLSFKQFEIMLKLMRAWPEGSELPKLDANVDQLAALKYIVQVRGKWFPSEKGVAHFNSRAA